MPVVAVLWPREKALGLHQWTSGDVRLPGIPHPRSDDAVAGYWMRMTRQEVLVTIPSLVEHPDDVPSVKGGTQRAGKGRNAFLFIGDADPLEITWLL